jgi:hypothetical protein
MRVALGCQDLTAGFFRQRLIFVKTASYER